jgi:hypothetical protein
MRNMSPLSYALKNKPTKKPKFLATRYRLVSFLAYFSTMKLETTRLNFNGLHSFLSQKTELHITAVVTTSNPTSVFEAAICMEYIKEWYDFKSHLKTDSL